MNSKKDDRLPDWINTYLLPIRDLAQHMDSFFNRPLNPMKPSFAIRPFRINVHETNSDVIITAELPGYSRDQINIEVLGHRLRIYVDHINIIKDKNKQQTDDSNLQTSRIMERFITLPFEIPESETKASFINGILTLTVPKKDFKRKYINIDD